jgi:hypothetical protein
VGLLWRTSEAKAERFAQACLDVVPVPQAELRCREPNVCSL